jgi:hypothetical protein
MKAIPNYLYTNMQYERATFSDRMRGGGGANGGLICKVECKAIPRRAVDDQSAYVGSFN